MCKIRFGIMGAAKIAGKFMDAMNYVKNAEAVTVASSSMERAEAFREKYGLSSADSYESMLKRSDIDAVYIATTQNFHKEHVLMCLRHGKHVLCEKAMALSEADAKEMFLLAEEKGLFLMEAMWSRFLPNILKAKKWIESGKIGNIQSAAASLGFVNRLPAEGRILNPALGGGGMYDIGVYAVEVLSWLMGGKIRDVKSFMRPHPVTGVDERVTMLLRYDVADAVVDISVSSALKQFMLINGTMGRIEIPAFHVGNKCIFTSFEDGAVEEYTEEFPGGNGFVYEIEETARCIMNGKTHSDVVPPETTYECARVFDAVLRGMPFDRGE